MKLATLYKTNKNGKTQVFNITVDGRTYTVSYGLQDGKMQTKSTTCEAKNVGRSNATSPEEQAIIEAKAVWTKKQKANYSTSMEAPVIVKLPMKVNDYHKHKSKVIFPCYTSAKLNGVNAEYRLVGGELILLSRGGENYPVPAHQKDEILALMEHLKTTSINGEMYIHGEHLQNIMAATTKHNELTPRLVFWIFELR
jgi:ATP-dependent DNA ligase